MISARPGQARQRGTGKPSQPGAEAPTRFRVEKKTQDSGEVEGGRDANEGKKIKNNNYAASSDEIM